MGESVVAGIKLVDSLQLTVDGKNPGAHVVRPFLLFPDNLVNMSARVTGRRRAKICDPLSPDAQRRRRFALRRLVCQFRSRSLLAFELRTQCDWVVSTYDEKPEQNRKPKRNLGILAVCSPLPVDYFVLPMFIGADALVQLLHDDAG